MSQSNEGVMLISPEEQESIFQRQMSEYEQMNPSQRNMFLESMSLIQQTMWIQYICEQICQTKEALSQTTELLNQTQKKLDQSKEKCNQIIHEICQNREL